MRDFQHFFETNKGLWDQLAALHKDSEWYEVEAFKNGQSSLRELELTELGEVRNKSLLHLQCHFGMDTLSWAREGAIVTGVDISEEAISAAQALSSEISVPGDFICADVYSSPQKLKKQFDIVFTSYGVLGWLPDLNEWARVVRHFLRPGGTFYIAEFHPFIWLYDENFEHIKYSYFNRGPDYEINEGSYVDRDAPIKHGAYYWSHPLGEVANALVQQGLNLEFIHEFDYVNYNCLNGLEEIGKYRYILPKWGHKIPYMYSIKASLPAE